MEIAPHGGGCCGITHIFSFHPVNVNSERQGLDRLKRLLTTITEELEEENMEYDEVGNETKPWRGRFGHLVEIALTDQQMMVWAPHLKVLGFKLCDRFRNDNSGNVVNLLTYKTKKSVPKKPYKW